MPLDAGRARCAPAKPSMNQLAVPHATHADGVHPAYVRAICAMVARAGGDADLVLARAGIEPAQLDDGAPMLPLSLLRWLVYAVEQASGQPWRALDTGASVRVESHGLLGEALKTCANLREAVALVERFQRLRNGIVEVRLEAVPGGLVYRIEPRVNLGDARRFVLEHVAASASRQCRDLSGGSLDGARIDLPWPRPPWHALIERYLPPPRFDAAGLALHLPDALLARANPRADAPACADAVRRCEAALAASQPTFAQQVQAWVERHQGPAARDCSLLGLAAELGLSSRTVIRRLREAGTDFGSIVSAVQRERARALLLGTDLPLAEVGRALGFNDASNFGRSVRRWFGLTPAELRAARRDGHLVTGPAISPAPEPSSADSPPP
jgi:AraC-like DNA-binding protein